MSFSARIGVLASFCLASSASLASLAPLPARASAANPSPASFVQVNGTRFEVDGKPLRFVGANLWYGMNLGSQGPGGDRARLSRELDRLERLGVTQLRILAASEGPDGEPWRIAPALQPVPGAYDARLLEGLDFLLAEMAARGMRAVICLNNFWPWSGGMAQYVRWFGGEPIPYPPPAEGGSWEAFQEYSSRFYSNEPALLAFEDLIRAIVTRTNSIHGRPYAQDPTIMAWQLANEPRGIRNVAAFSRWIDRTAAFIKSLDPRHLVTTGSEGETPTPQSAGLDFLGNHRSPWIDFATAHVWAQNWGWFDPERPEATYPRAAAAMRAYLEDHVAKAWILGKPLVVEEFGLARDGGSFAPSAGTAARDRYYGDLFEIVRDSAARGAPLAGASFWAWSGEGRPRAPHGGAWSAGDPFIGDPPHEPQGWYGVYDSDLGTQAVISRYAHELRRLGASDAVNASTGRR